MIDYISFGLCYVCCVCEISNRSSVKNLHLLLVKLNNINGNRVLAINRDGTNCVINHVFRSRRFPKVKYTGPISGISRILDPIVSQTAT